MAITASERADILELLVVMFDAAPGAGILADVVTLYETAAGRDLASLAGILGNTGVFQLLHPIFESAEEFAAELLAPLGLAGDGPATDWVIGQYNAGATKAAIMHGAWDFFDDLPSSAPAQYLAAQATMQNKAQVAEYYSVVLARSSGSIAVLQDVVSGVGADAASVDAAIAQLIEGAATGPVLTRGVDLLTIFGNAPTTITGLVDGDADGNTADASFGTGDRITGNANTRLQLTVLESGQAGFVRLQSIDSVDIAAAATGTVAFNAADWTGVDAVRLAGGIDGLAVTVAYARAGMDIAIAQVRGSIGAQYDTGGGHLSALLRSDDPASSGRIAVETGGLVDIDMGTGMTALIANTSGMALGNISVSGGDLNAFTAAFDTAGSLSVGALDATVGMQSSLRVDFDSVDGHAGAARVFLEAGDASSAVLRMQDVAGDATVGDVRIALGDRSTGSASFQGMLGDVAVGDVILSAGLSSTLAAEFAGVTAGTLTLDDVRIDAGDSADIALAAEGFGAATITGLAIEAAASASVEVAFTDLAGGLVAGDAVLRTGGDSLLSFEVSGVGGGVTLDDVSLRADGARSSVAMAVHTVTGDVVLGSISTLAGATSDVTLLVQDAANLRVQALAQAVGANSTAAVALAVGEPGGMLAVGDVSLVLGAASEGGVSIANSNAHVGTSTVGDVSVQAGSDSALDLTLLHLATLPPGEGVTGPSVGQGAVGDIAMSVGGAGSLTATARIEATVLYGGKAAGIDAGNFLVGDVSLAVGDGFHSGTLDNAAEASFMGLGFATASLGNVDIGNIELSGGDYASLSAVAGGVIAGPGTLGIGSIGDVTFRAGESAAVNFEAYWAGIGADAIGSVDIGTIAVSAAQDAQVDIGVLHGAYSATVENIGSLVLGGVEAVLGDNARVSIAIEQTAHDAGDLRIGDIALAVSATTAADLAGGSVIDVDIARRGTGGGAHGGDLEVGDITLAAGDAASIDLDIAYTGAFDDIGDVEIGTIGLSVGDGASAVNASVLVRSEAGGDLGGFLLGGVAIALGDHSAAAVDIRLQHGGLDGDFEDVSLGALDLALGEDSVAAIVLDLSMSAEASVDDFSIGNIDVTLASGADADLDALDIEAGSIGEVSVGRVDAQLQAGATLQLGLRVDAAEAAGAMDVGDMALTLSGGGSMSVAFHISAGEGDADLVAGDIALDLQGTDEGDAVLVDLRADGGVALGNVSVSGEGRFSFAWEDRAGANMSVIAIDAGAAASIGDVDLSGFTGDANLDLAWAATGAAIVTAGSGDDAIRGNGQDNVITGGEGVDTIDLREGGSDTIVTRLGDSGKAAGTFDTIIGFSGDDRLDFQVAAGSSGNYVERSANFATIEEFLANAKDALGPAVRYFVQDNGTDTYIAVNHGSGEADVVIVLAGVADATTLNYLDFVA